VTAFNPFTGSDQLQVDRAEGRGAVLCRDGVVHGTAGNIFELLITDRFWFVGLFAHFGWVLGLVTLVFPEAGLEKLIVWDLDRRTYLFPRSRNRPL
jgi:hypothetical protein